MLFTWSYSHARGGAVVYANPPLGEREEVGRVNNGNIAQILCDALAAVYTDTVYVPRHGQNDGRAEAMMTWLGYINPPRPGGYDEYMLRTQEGELRP